MTKLRLLLAFIFVLLTVEIVSAQQYLKIGSETKLLTKYSADAVTTDETARCLNCHSTRMPKLVETWEKSTHAKNGVGCYECHKAEKGDETARQGHFSFNVQLPVSPAKCGFCHQQQYEEFASSLHATAFDKIKFMPMRESDPELFEASCTTCHGSLVKLKKGKPVDNSWPNHGIGRVNPDGSLGSCAACHGFHTDSLKVVRDSSVCKKCHDTDFSPAYTNWSMSMHGSASDKAIENVDFTRKHLNLTDDPVMKPNCQTCHMLAPDKKSASTHNVSARISWKFGSLKAEHKEDWGEKRLNMQKSCRNCHGSTQVEQYYRRLDAAVVATNHLVDKKITADSPFWEKMNLQKTLMSFRVGFAMLGIVNPLDLESLLH